MPPPPLNLPGKSIRKALSNKVLCPNCGRANRVSIVEKALGKVICKRCGRIIKV